MKYILIIPLISFLLFACSSPNTEKIANSKTPKEIFDEEFYGAFPVPNFDIKLPVGFETEVYKDGVLQE